MGAKFSKELDHSQILLRRKDLVEEVKNHSTSIARNILYCIYYGPEHPEYKVRLMAASLQAEYIARFVYRGKEGYMKLGREFYAQRLFLGFCESAGEVQDRLEGVSGERISEEEAERILEKYLSIKLLWVKAIVFFFETPFASELAYGTDYVITHEGLPSPDWDVGMIPFNYPQYDPSKGIGEEFFGYQMGINKKDKKFAVLDKINNMDMCVVTCAAFLPDTYLSDMKELFGADPKSDTVSNVYWSTNDVKWTTDGVVTVINNMPRELVCQKLIKYAKERDIAEWHLLYKDDEKGYIEISYDNSGDEFYEGCDVMLSFDGALWDGLFTINTSRWKKVALGINK